MCRSIKRLHFTARSTAPDPEPAGTSPEEIRAAALQFVRKISGYRVPSKANAAAFEQAVDEIASNAQKLLLSLR